MFLTQDQRDLLRRASSGYNGQDFATLEPEDIAYYTRRVEDAIREIYAANPNAFIFKYKNTEKVDIREACLDRKFYHSPMGMTNYKSAKKHKILFPEHLQIKQGV